MRRQSRLAFREAKAAALVLKQRLAGLFALDEPGIGKARELVAVWLNLKVQALAVEEPKRRVPSRGIGDAKMTECHAGTEFAGIGAVPATIPAFGRDATRRNEPPGHLNGG